MIITFVSNIVIAALWGYMDGKRNDRGLPIFLAPHFAAWIARCFPPFIIATYEINPVWGNGEFIDWVGALIATAGVWWIVFDMAYNFARKLKLTRVGTTSILDKIFTNKKNPFISQLIVKVALILIGILLYAL